MLRDRRRDVGEKVRELSARPRGRHAPAPLGKIAEHGHHVLDGNVLAAKRLESDQAIERALQLAHVVELETADLVDHAGAEPHAALLALGLEDRHARLEVRRADVDDQSAGEARDQPLVDVGDLGRRPIARHDDLPPVARQRVEDAQQLALRLRCAGEELDVVDQQHADAACSAALNASTVARRDRRVQLADELVERDAATASDGRRCATWLPIALMRCVLPSPDPL